MKNIDFKKEILPHLIAVALMYVITAFFFAPLLKGKTLKQSDIEHSKGVLEYVKDYENQSGQDVYWNPAIFGGTPVYIVGETYSDFPIKSQLMKALSLWLPSPASLIFLCMLFTYICLIAYGLHPIIAFMGAFAFGFSSFNITSVEAGHNAKILAVSFLPLIIAGIAILFQKRYWLGSGLLAIGLSLQIYSGHIQITYYTLLLAGLIYLINGVILISKKEYKPLLIIFLVSALAAGLAGASNISKLYAGSEYIEHSIRGQRVVTDPTKPEGEDQTLQNGLDRDYAFSWSNGIWEPFTLLVPHFYGGGSSGDFKMEGTELYKKLKSQGAPNDQIQNIFKSSMYWGDQPFTAGPIYIGAIICFLFVLGVLVAPNDTRIWLIVGTFFFAALSMGSSLNLISFDPETGTHWLYDVFPSLWRFEASTGQQVLNPNYLMFDHFPMYNKFRTVSMTIFVTCFVMVFGAMIGLQGILNSIKTKNKDLDLYLYIAGGLTGGLTLIFFLFSGSFSFSKVNEHPQLESILDLIMDARDSIFAADALKSFFFIAAAFTAIYFWRSGKLKSEVALMVIAGLVVLDTLILDAMYLGSEKFKKSKRTEIAFTATPADNFIIEDIKKNELKNTRTYNATARPDQDSRTSYFHMSIGGYHPAKMRRIQDLYEYYFYGLNQERAQKVDRILNMLNVRYVKRGETPEAVLLNTNSCGNAWFIESIEGRESPQEVIESLGDINPATQALVNSAEYADLVGKKFNANGSIDLVEFTPNKLTYNTDNSADGFVVFSEIHYPHGWEVMIDGKPVEGLSRVNYLLRGLNVPAGKHEITMEFKPFSYTTGDTITLIATLLVLLGGIGAIYLEFNKGLIFKKKETVS